MVPTTFGWLWPSAVTAMPPVKSRYSLPSLSHTRTRSPRTSATGARLAVYIRCLSAHSIRVFVSVMCLGLADECGSQNDFGTDSFLGEDLEEDGVGDAAVDDVGLL